METRDAVKALAALAQESRLNVFRMLVEAGPAGLNPGAIASRTGIAGPTLSFHLKELVSAGLVSARQEGRFIIYAPRFDRMGKLLEFLTHDCCRGHPELCLPAATVAVRVRPPKRRAKR